MPNRTTPNLQPITPAYHDLPGKSRILIDTQLEQMKSATLEILNEMEATFNKTIKQIQSETIMDTKMATYAVDVAQEKIKWILEHHLPAPLEPHRQKELSHILKMANRTFE